MHDSSVRLRLLAAFLVALAAGLALGSTGEDAALDAYWSWTLPAPGTGPVAPLERSRVVLVDLALPGGGVADRAEIARAVRHCAALGAWAVGLDVAFDGPGQRASDDALAAALKDAPRAVLATSYNRLTLTDAVPYFRGSAAGQANVVVEPDGFVRRVQHYFREERFSTRTSFSLQLAHMVLAHPSREPPTIEPSASALRVRAGAAPVVEVPVDDQGRTILAYRGAGGAVPVLKPAELYRLDPRTTTFAGKAVILGAIDANGEDSFETPFHRAAHARISGAELHAQALLGLLQSDPPRRAGAPARLAALAFAAAAGVLACALASALALALALSALATMTVVASCALFASWGLLIAPPGVLAALATGAALRRALSRPPAAPAVVAPVPPAPEPAPAADPVDQALGWLAVGRTRDAVTLLQKNLPGGARLRWALALALAALDELDLAMSHASEMNAAMIPIDDLYRLAREFEDHGAAEGATRLYRRIRMQDLNYRDVQERLAAIENTDPSVPEPLRRALAGRYRELRILGAGGQAKVYRAVDRELDCEVAVKVPDMVPDDPKFGQRFVREVQTLKRLEHPNIVRVLDVGTETLPYYTMELLSGASLRAEWEGQEVHVRVALETLLPVLEALAVCHAQGVVHRDLKPENILLDADGVPRLTDFGLAFDETRSRLTRTGATMGTPSYMAPEQIEGEDPSPAIDVYAFGTVLYEALVGSVPFPRGELYQKVLGDATPLRSTRPEIDPELAALVDACLARVPADRPADARALLERLAPIATRLSAG